MSEQLYRWVKASDKPLELLNHGDRVSVLYRRLPNSLICLEDEGIKRWCFWRLGHGSHQHVKKDDWKVIEWLEPYTPSPVSGSLEDAEPVYHDYKSDWEYHCRVSGGYSYETFLSTLLDDPEFYKIWCSKKTQRLHK